MDDPKSFVLSVYPHAKLAGMQGMGFMILNKLKKKSICLSRNFCSTEFGAWHQAAEIILQKTLATFET